MVKRHEIPKWAPRLSKGIIRRLYETDAAGIYDEELLDIVGYGLLARCRSFITAVEATQGQAACPHCDNKIPHNNDKNFLLHCENCNWELRWADYFTTIQHKQLSGAQPVLELFSEFIEYYPQETTPQGKMFRIDKLLHGFHYFFKYNTPTRPVAVNLIKGRLSDVIEFLDSLSYSNVSTHGLFNSRTNWQENIKKSKNWNKSVNDS